MSQKYQVTNTETTVDIRNTIISSIKITHEFYNLEGQCNCGYSTHGFYRQKRHWIDHQASFSYGTISDTVGFQYHSPVSWTSDSTHWRFQRCFRCTRTQGFSRRSSSSLKYICNNWTFKLNNWKKSPAFINASAHIVKWNSAWCYHKDDRPIYVDCWTTTKTHIKENSHNQRTSVHVENKSSLI